MKTWVSFLLPTDEYKEKRFLYFYTEGAVLLVLSLIVMAMLNLNTSTVIGLAIAIFLLYVTVRYTISGMEYTDVTSEKAYKKELRVIYIRTMAFVIILLPLIFLIMPVSLDDFYKIIINVIVVSLICFFASLISLKRSYKKNKELL
ncbi:hypothetical protein [Evansella cellulosilytica]|uniref:DUF3278 domain-containing protein n=1 Tax=Evansella cellulosilytica (strain ATCC 21833 / DSM 2522 / FERM P-1141 / JCM 9156 / N-4) TaxID=649639 RepID=E6TVN3_EVAC2|nr:hypothetical protein [Evansella cellulosilytica]ADU32161.1 hypothetical protein Bcell_3926 [Evansella cellulosilytica DSM 2522]